MSEQWINLPGTSYFLFAPSTFSIFSSPPQNLWDLNGTVISADCQYINDFDFTAVK